MHLTRMRLGSVPPFTEPVEFKFHERVNVFVGPNSSGKSTVLLVLADRFIGTDQNSKRPISQGMDPWWLSEFPTDAFDKFVQDELEQGNQPNVIAASEDWYGTKWEYHRPEIAPAFIHIGSLRDVLPGISEMESIMATGEDADDILREDFSGLGTVRAYAALGDKLWSEEPSERVPYARARLVEAGKLADNCSRSICGEVIVDSGSHNYIPNPYALEYLHHPQADPSNIRILRMMGINTNDARNFSHLPIFEQPSEALYQGHANQPPVYLGHLSAGTEGTLLWIRWLAVKILHHYGFIDGWEKQPAVLLIDEIENHLHPTWQRRVIPALLEHFPGLQIFATTHSPFVVAGWKAGQVHLLNRDENGVVTATTNTEDVVGWTADEILRVFMGVDDPTDKDTAEAAAALRKLRDEGPRVDEREEERRQSEIARLRQIVDRAELSGPRVAEDARFLADLESILERHRESQELNQENG